MAGEITPEFIIISVNNLRIAEDAISAVLLLFIIGMLLNTIFRSIRNGPLANRLWGLAIAFLPFLMWKLLGAFRRIFIENSNPVYTSLNDFGEVMESVSALFILVSLIYMYMLLRPGK